MLGFRRLADANHQRQIAGAHLLVEQEMNDAGSCRVRQGREEHRQVAISIRCLQDCPRSGDSLGTHAADLTLIGGSS